MALTRWHYQHGEWHAVSVDVAGGEPELLDGAGSNEPVLYTTLRTAGGNPLLAAAHQARLESSCRELRWPTPPAAADWQRLIGTAAKESGGEIRARISLRLWLKENALRGLIDPEPLQLPTPIRLWPAPPGSERTRAHLKLRDATLRERESQAEKFGAGEAILRRGDGVVTETTRSNLLWSDADGRIYHPAGPALPGVMLDWTLAELRMAGREIIAREAVLQELASAAELFVTSAVKGPMPAVIVFGDRVSGDGLSGDGVCGVLQPNSAAAPGPVGKYLAQRYARLLARTAAGEFNCTP